jgi:hypothetical protein
VQLLVKPVQESGEKRVAVILFIEGEPVEEVVSSEPQVSDETIRRLKEELELTQQRLRTLNERHAGS